MSSVLFINDAVKTMTKYNNKSKDQEYSEQLQNHELILNISPENLSIPQTNMKHRFNKQTIMCWNIINRHTIFNICTIILALSCIFFQIFKLPKVLENSQSIEMIKRDLEILQRQFSEANFLTEFEALEKEMYDDEVDDMSSDDADINENDDYDNYDDEDYKSEVHEAVKKAKMDAHIISTTSQDVIQDSALISRNISKFKHTNNEKFYTNAGENKTDIESDQLAVTSNNKNDSKFIQHNFQKMGNN